MLASARALALLASVPPSLGAITSPISLDWAGLSWSVKTGQNLGPGPNTFDPQLVSVTEGGALRLALTSAASSEVWSNTPLGYGTYISHATYPLDLDPQATLGLFVWDGSFVSPLCSLPPPPFALFLQVHKPARPPPPSPPPTPLPSLKQTTRAQAAAPSQALTTVRLTLQRYQSGATALTRPLFRLSCSPQITPTCAGIAWPPAPPCLWRASPACK